MDYTQHIWIDAARRSGQPCVRGTRITVGDVLGYLASGMSVPQVIHDYPQLTEAGIRACLTFAAEREKRSAG